MEGPPCGSYNTPDGRTFVLLIDSEAPSVEIVTHALAAEAGKFHLDVAGRLDSGLERIAAGGIDIILVHLPLPDADGFAGIEPTLRAAGATPVIVLSPHDDAEHALLAVKAGAQDYLVTGRLKGASLVRCIRHTIERHRRTKELFTSAPARGRGKIMTFLGVKGGAGATTTLLNLAAALGARGRRTIAAELGPLSSFAIHLQRPGDFDRGDFLDLDPTKIDSRAVEERLVSLPFGFRVLSAAPGIGEERLLRAEQARALVERAGELAEFVLVDLPARISPMHRAVAAASDFVAVLLEPDPVSIQFAKQTIQLLDKWGVETAARGLLVVNRAPLSNSILPREVRTRTACKLVGVIPSAGEACVIAFETNTLLFTAQPEARFSQAIEAIADRLLETPIGVLEL